MSDLDMKKLEAIFWGDQREQPTRVRLERVVKALRGVVDQAYSEGRASKVRGDNENVQRQWVDALINEILGAAGEKVAGGPSSNEDTVTAPRRAAPATAPAPAVCEWVLKEPSAGFVPACSTDVLVVFNHDGNCPFCGKPIQFTEAKT